MNSGSDGPVLDDKRLSRLRETLSRHGVSFAMVFGSIARDEAGAESDLDVAITFENVGPEDDGYSDVYLRLHSAVTEAFPFPVDVVDVRTMPQSFAASVFESGEVILGTEEQRAELQAELAGSELSTRAAKDRVAAAVERLRGDAESDSGKV